MLNLPVTASLCHTSMFDIFALNRNHILMWHISDSQEIVACDESDLMVGEGHDNWYL